MIKTLLKNLSFFDNWQTMLVTFVLEPFFMVLFFYLVSPHTQVDKLILTTLSLSAASSIIGIYAALFVAAENIDILKEIFIDFKGFFRFNISVLLVTGGVAVLQSGILLGVYRLLKFEVQIEMKTALLLILTLLVFSSIFAMISGLLSFQGNNPYFFSNLLVGLLPIVSATIVPITVYPAWLAIPSKIFPFWSIQDLIWTGKFQTGWNLFYFLVCMMFLILIIVRKRKSILSS